MYGPQLSLRKIFLTGYFDLAINFSLIFDLSKLKHKGVCSFFQMRKIYLYQRTINMKNSDMEFTINAKVELTLLLSTPSHLIRKLKNSASHGTSQAFKVWKTEYMRKYTHTHTCMYVCIYICLSPLKYVYIIIYTTWQRSQSFLVGTSLVAPWLRIHLAMQRMWIWSWPGN